MAPKLRPKRDRFQGLDPFDLWLCRALHRQHDVAAEEEVPGDLLRLAADGQAEREALAARWVTIRNEA